jgi:hypothetical protein
MGEQRGCDGLGEWHVLRIWIVDCITTFYGCFYFLTFAASSSSIRFLSQIPLHAINRQLPPVGLESASGRSFSAS